MEKPETGKRTKSITEAVIKLLRGMIVNLNGFLMPLQVIRQFFSVLLHLLIESAKIQHETKQYKYLLRNN